MQADLNLPSIYELWHNKTNNVAVRPPKTQISLGICPVWSESSLCAQWVAKDPRFLHGDSEDSNQTGFCHEAAHVFVGFAESGSFSRKLTGQFMCFWTIYFCGQLPSAGILLSHRMTKPIKWPVRPADSDQPGHPPSLIRAFAVRLKKFGCPGWFESSLGAHHFFFYLFVMRFYGPVNS